MADRPPAPVSRVGRPRTRSVQQSRYVPAPKVGRPRSKSAYQSEVKEVSKKNPTKQVSQDYSSIGTRHHTSNRPWRPT